MYVGCCNRATPYFATSNGVGVAAFRFDAATGAATPLGVTAGVENPTFVAIGPSGSTIYATSEVLGWNEGLVSAYAIDPRSGALSYINKQPTRGSIAAQASFDRTGRFLFVANYGMGSVTERPNRSLVVYALKPDGEISAPIAEATHEGVGSDPARQERPHAHSVLATPDNRHLVVADLGLDKLIVYRFDASTGAIARHSELTLPPASGPRHFVFHPTLPRAYVGNEMGSTVATLGFDAAAGRFETFAITPTVPEAARANNHCSEIRISADGRRLYVANRGHDSLSRFAIDPASGMASLIDTTPSGGKTPRHFAFDPSGRFLAVANQDSDRISIFAVDRSDGALKLLPGAIATGTPTNVVFVRIG
jgi:6-phosphogluconolactonase